MSDPVVSPVLAADEETTIRVLADAFSADPVMVWLFDEDPAFPEAMIDFFSVVTRAYRHHGLTFRLDDEGAAIWSPPAVEVDLSGLAKVIGAHVDAGRHDEVRTAFSRLTAHHPTGPHFYLQAIGVRPGSRGRGAGTRLLRHTLETCDRAGTAAYLESSNPRNLPFYERHRFEVTAEVEFDPDVVVRPMLRPPQR